MELILQGKSLPKSIVRLRTYLLEVSGVALPVFSKLSHALFSGSQFSAATVKEALLFRQKTLLCIDCFTSSATNQSCQYLLAQV